MIPSLPPLTSVEIEGCPVLPGEQLDPFSCIISDGEGVFPNRELQIVFFFNGFFFKITIIYFYFYFFGADIYSFCLLKE